MQRSGPVSYSVDLFLVVRHSLSIALHRKNTPKNTVTAQQKYIQYIACVPNKEGKFSLDSSNIHG